MRCALLFCLAGCVVLPPGVASAQMQRTPSVSGSGWSDESPRSAPIANSARPSPSDDPFDTWPRNASAVPPRNEALRPNGPAPRSYSTFDTTQRTGVMPAGDEQPTVDQPPGMPLREAYQSPDYYRTPNPTPLERVPAPDNGYTPRMMPGQHRLPPLPPIEPQKPIPPLAPLVNIRFSETWLPAARDDVGMNDVDFRGTFALEKTGSVLVTPGYGMHFLNGPTRTDLPGTLYDTYLDFRFKKQFDNCWGLELAFTPSWYSDGDNTSSEAWRFITTAIGFYQATTEVQLLAGLMYLDRFDINWFPVFGFIWSDPSGESDWRYEVVFPRPKFARRVLHCDDKDGWIYLAGEFGGGAWAIERANGGDDMVAIRDWRAMLGYESKVKDFSAISWFVETGFVFNRQIEYASGRGDFDPDACAMLRFGMWY